MARCALCACEAELQESHIIPAFVFRHMRKNSATGFIRNTDNVDLRVQDGAKLYLLCAECEGLLSKDETLFSSQLFKPWLRNQGSVEYHEWLNRFCVSVSWRVLLYCQHKNPESQRSDFDSDALKEAESIWRAYLLHEKATVGRFEQHLIMTDIVESASDVERLPENISRYLAGVTEMDVPGNSRTLMTYAKLGRFIIRLFGFER